MSRQAQMLARYNAWANKLIFEAVAALPAGEATRPRQTLFKNMVHTLNHNYVIDRIFQAHLEGRPHGYGARNTPDHPPLDELWRTQQELDAWYVENEFTGRRDHDAAELASLRELRPVLRELLTVDRDRAAELVNAHLAEARALPQLRRHDGLDWHIHAVSPEAPLDRRIAVETAMAMVDVIRADELSRLSVCADERCNGLVLDLSRNRSRRFCTTTCANRNAVAAYRARQASS